MGRSLYFPFGTQTIYPNQYILLHGLPASRKSTAVNVGTALLNKANYKRFAPSRMSRESFVKEMYELNKPERLGYDIADLLDMEADYPHELTVHAPEFIDFIGQNDNDYIMLLTQLWDNLDKYSNPKVTRGTVELIKPTVNLLGASTAKSTSMAFPSTAMDSGALSRYIIIHSDPSPKEILIPSTPTKDEERAIVTRLEDIKTHVKGPAILSAEAKEILSYIYSNSRKHSPADPRLLYYHGRRQAHLLKLSMIVAATRTDVTIEGHDILLANTLLAVAEHTMSRALGNFGRSRQSTITHDMVEWIREKGVPVKMLDIYKQFSRDFSSEREFQDIMTDLQSARRLIPVKDDNRDLLGLTVKDDPFPAWQKDIIIVEELTAHERDIIGF